jgi:hypothetical protein
MSKTHGPRYINASYSRASVGKKTSGSTLIELLISASLMLIIFGAMTEIIIKGMSYLRSTQGALDAERSGLALLTSIERELEHTKDKLVEYPFSFSPPPAVPGTIVVKEPGVYGVVFMDPYSNQNFAPLNLTTTLQTQIDGTLLWQRYVAYYLNPINHTVYRCECPYNAYSAASGLTAPPNANGSFVPFPGIPPLNLTWFETQTTYPDKTVVAQNIAAFNVTQHVISIPPAPTISVINVTVEAGDANATTVNSTEGYWMNITTQIHPRN